jgi:hypothetical protein
MSSFSIRTQTAIRGKTLTLALSLRKGEGKRSLLALWSLQEVPYVRMESVPNALAHPRELKIHLPVPETQHLHSLFSQETIPLMVSEARSRVSVSLPVQFNHQPGLARVEIHNMPERAVLPSELKTREPAISENLPDNPLSTCRTLPQHSRSACGDHQCLQYSTSDCDPSANRCVHPQKVRIENFLRSSMAVKHVELTTPSQQTDRQAPFKRKTLAATAPSFSLSVSKGEGQGEGSTPQLIRFRPINPHAGEAPCFPLFLLNLSGPRS